MQLKKYVIKLTESEREPLRRLLKSGTHTAQSITRANILLKLDESLGEKREQLAVAKICGVSTLTAHVTQEFLFGRPASV
jgi:hypothetical protein